MEKHNPNSNCRETSISWSELPQDLLNSMFERLGIADFQRAKSVCSSWHSASRQSVPKNQIHWLVLFPEHNSSNNSCCTLFNPEEKDKYYKTQEVWFDHKSRCLATYGSWFLMQDSRYDLYITNLFTKEMINLPPKEKGMLSCSVFWIDEKTKDYVVLFGRFNRLEKLDVVYHSSKNDNSLWKQIPETSKCFHLVYKDHKLYYLSLFGIFKIFDFREDIPKEIFKCGVTVDMFRTAGHVQLQPSDRLCLVATQLVVNVTGEKIFKVEKFMRPISRTWYFQVSMFYSGFLGMIQLIDSLGEEAMLLDQGITVVAGAGFIRNSIYFSDCSENKKKKYHNFFRFDMETKKTEQLHEFDSSSLEFSRARWFLPHT